MNDCEAVIASALLELPLLPVEAATLMLQLPAFAEELPVKVIAALNTPALDKLPCPNDAVTPAGNPLAAKLTLVSFSPPTGVTFTVI